MSIEIVPSGGPIGAEIRGVDLAQPLDGATFAAIEKAFDDFAVIYFRDQRITPDQQLAFSRRFGDLEINAFDKYALPEHPGVLIVSNIQDASGNAMGYADAGSHWHTDMSYTRTPPRATMLYAIEVPTADGRTLGDTCFASATAAYDALPAATKYRLHGLIATHRFAAKQRGVKAPVKLTAEQIAKYPDVDHPVARTHPTTGRKALYVRESECIGIPGIPEDEALPLIKQLSDHIVREEFQYRHNWREGDLLIWDNAAVQHIALRDYAWPQRRLMHRITVAGSVPF